MPKYTRRTRRRRQGGAWFSSSSTNDAASAISNAKAKAAYNLAHSKSRVANIFAKPGQVVYTNKDRIRSELQQKIEQIADEYGIVSEDFAEIKRSAEGVSPKEAVSSLKSFAQMLNEKTIEAAPTGAAVVLTLPVFAAQLLYKAIWIFIAIWIFFASIGGILMGSDTSGLIKAALPNAKFNTTKSSFVWLRNYFQSM